MSYANECLRQTQFAASSLVQVWKLSPPPTLLRQGHIHAIIYHLSGEFLIGINARRHGQYQQWSEWELWCQWLSWSYLGRYGTRTSGSPRWSGSAWRVSLTSSAIDLCWAVGTRGDVSVPVNVEGYIYDCLGSMPNMSDSARKRMLADWVVKTKKQVVKLYALVKWARDADTVQKAMVNLARPRTRSD